MKKLATLLAAVMLLTTVFGVVSLSSAADTVIGGYGYYYNQAGNPVMDFVDEADNAQVGVWWWSVEDATESTNTRDKYLNFLEENGVNEIYFYGYYLLQHSSDRATLHTFVQEANRRGMAISFIYDDNDTIMGSSSALDDVCDEYLNYLNAYPTDKLNGIHFDVEHETVQTFANNLVSQFPNARNNRHVPISMDVNCEMNTSTTVSAGGTTGNIYEVIAANVDTLTLMSYKDTYAKIWSLGAKALAAAKAKGCRVVFAVETGDYSSNVAPHYKSFNDPGDEFAQETKEYMYGELAKVYEALQADHPTGGFGVAIHQHEDWYNLKKSDTPISTSGGSKTERQTVSHASVSETSATTRKTNPATPLEETVLWSGTVDQQVIIGDEEDYVGRLSGDVAEAINTAIRNDIAKNGTISGDEYYEISTTGSVSGNSGYATVGFMINGDEQIWWDESKMPGGVLIDTADGTYSQHLYGTMANKKGDLFAEKLNNTTELVYFSDARGYTDICTVDSLVIKVFRHAAPTGTESSATTASSAVSSGTESSATSSATDPSFEPSETGTNATTATSATETATEQETVATETGDITLYGDANDDGAVNMKDVLVMRKALAGMSISLNHFNADVSRDGAVNMRDVLVMRKFLAGLIAEL